MSQSSAEHDLFGWLDDEYLEVLVVKLNALPSGDEFRRRAAEAIETTVGVAGADRTYDEIQKAHGGLIGVVEGDGGRLPWWLREFKWTVASEQLSELELSDSTLDEFEQYPRESTYIQSIELSGAEALSKALDAFVALEGSLNSALQMDPAELEAKHGIEASQYELPDQLFMLPESGVATTDSFEQWFGRVLNLCPPAEPTMTALLRANVGTERRSVGHAITDENLQRLEELKILESTEEDARVFNEAYYEHLTTLLEIEGPFDLVINIEHDKDELTDLQYLYYQSWAVDTERRLAEEQRWLQAARDNTNLSEAERFRFANYAFRMPLRLDSDQVVFTHQSRYGNSNATGRSSKLSPNTVIH
ncbi:hypothetical protein [Haladaptatus sp. GCM10025893]|uniref:hypothetical protein n=1 Tax=Haladaptatus sp. GCM10025893 TaxID=3252659 RepID=UPI003606FBD6